ncbi:class F sortase [Actinacidiphila acididurans]|uniref:Class F sortase n=1 Tax=Actinacidiphila acididurans TaxID=2784346 RepID=A0ABS2U4G3_9ACTN|nr:class F sortase [Actinacidiphila acididurans]MBM9509887.1 class F sortase [Actinacidiphila acididurans]
MDKHPHAAQAGAPGSDVRTSSTLRWAVAAALLGALLIYNSAEGKGSSALPPPPPQFAEQAAVPTVTPRSAPTGPLAPALPRSVPTKLSIPAIGVNAPFMDLHLDPSGKLDVPPENNTNLVGWYADGPTPGERGNALVDGHVDTTKGPAVFLFLRLLKPGSTADITRADGTVATFRVDSVETFAKDNFPDDRVYGDTQDAELRLITCGGTYDRGKHDYNSNVVVFAHLESSRKA